MTSQQLRSSILQLAIQGKLVEQRPEEGTGAELVEKVSSQRARGEKRKGNAKTIAATTAEFGGAQP